MSEEVVGLTVAAAPTGEAAPETTPESAPQSTDWKQDIPEDIRGNFDKFTSQEDLYKSYTHLQRMVGQKEVINGLVKPSDNASPEDMTKFNTELNALNGVPATPDKYNLEGLEGIALDNPHTQEALNTFHQLGLNDTQVKGVFERLRSTDSQVQEAIIAQAEADKQSQIAQWSAQLSDEFGDRLQPTIKKAQVFFDAHVSTDIKQMIADSGLGAHPEMIKMFAKFQDSFGEDSIALTPSSPAPVAPKTRSEVQEMMKSKEYKTNPEFRSQVQKYIMKLNS